jgi:hypothetical protein
MLSILILTALGFASASPLIKRDGAKISGHVVQINADVTALNALLDKYDGGLLQALPVKTAAEKVETSMKAAVADVKQEPTPTPDEELQKVLDAVRKLNADVGTAMGHIKAKGDKFGAAKPIDKTIVTRLSDIEKDLGDSLQSRASSDSMKAKAKEEDEALRKMFTDAISAL